MHEQIQRALLLIEQRRPSEAKQLLMQCLTEDPNNDSVFGLLAQLELQADEYEQALEYINTAIGLDPQDAHYHLTKGRIYIQMKNYKLATDSLNAVRSIDPYEPLSYAYRALICNHKKDFSMSLVNADKCLAIDPENVFARNLRSTALLKLGREEEGYQTIEGALHEDPENSFTHSNYGWGLLEKGQGKKSLEHFRESLRLDPTNEYAKAGMAEALKANFFVYRWFLKYQFWMSNQVARNQWVFIIGFYVVFRVLSSVAERNPEYSSITTPILILAGLFAFSTWVMRPLSNLILRVNPYGRHLLDEEERKSSTYVGKSLLIAVLSGLGYLFTNAPVLLVLAVLGITMMLPLGRYFALSKTKNLFKFYAIGLLLLGLVSVVLTGLSGVVFHIVATVYVFAFIAYQWIANFQSIE